MKIAQLIAKSALALLVTFLLFMIIPIAQDMSQDRPPKEEDSIQVEQTIVFEEPQEETPPQPQEESPDMNPLATSMSRPARDLDMDFSPDLGVGDGGSIIGGGQGVRTSVMEEGDADTPPAPIRREPVAYPRAARRQGIEGTVVVTFVVDISGAVSNIQFEELPHPLFESPVRETLQRWRFRPGVFEGMPVAVRVRQSINFSLE